MITKVFGDRQTFWFWFTTLIFSTGKGSSIKRRIVASKGPSLSACGRRRPEEAEVVLFKRQVLERTALVILVGWWRRRRRGRRRWENRRQIFDADRRQKWRRQFDDHQWSERRLPYANFRPFFRRLFDQFWARLPTLETTLVTPMERCDNVAHQRLWLLLPHESTHNKDSRQTNAQGSIL